MKRFFLSIISMLLTIISYSQNLNDTKIIYLKLVSYDCGDYCYIQLKDEKNKQIFTYDNFETELPATKAIKDNYYNNNEHSTLIEQRYKATLEYKLVNKYEQREGYDPLTEKQKRMKEKRWIIKKIQKI